MHVLVSVNDEVGVCQHCGHVPVLLKAGRPVCAVGRRMQRGKTGDTLRAPRGGVPRGPSAGWVTKGYRYVRVDGKPRREHRVVMEAQLGRPLEEFEEVHHRNGRRLDNRSENLELWARSQPPGARVSDLIEWAVWLLNRYAPELLK